MQGVKRKGKGYASSANSWVAGIGAIRGETRLAVHGLWLLNCMAAKQKNIDERENIGTCEANYMVFKKEIDKRNGKVENGPSGKYLVWAPLLRLCSFILRAGCSLLNSQFSNLREIACVVVVLAGLW